MRAHGAARSTKAELIQPHGIRFEILQLEAFVATKSVVASLRRIGASRCRVALSQAGIFRQQAGAMSAAGEAVPTEGLPLRTRRAAGAFEIGADQPAILASARITGTLGILDAGLAVGVFPAEHATVPTRNLRSHRAKPLRRAIRALRLRARSAHDIVAATRGLVLPVQ